MNLTKKISITILNELMQEEAVGEKDYKKALYGVEVIISVLLQASGLIILGILLGILDRMIPVTLSFVLLRLFAGGYHADTCFKCFIMTFAMCAIGIKLAELASVSIIAMLMMLVVSWVLVLKLAPKDTKHKRMTEVGILLERNLSWCWLFYQPWHWDCLYFHQLTVCILHWLYQDC